MFALDLSACSYMFIHVVERHISRVCSSPETSQEEARQNKTASVHVYVCLSFQNLHAHAANLSSDGVRSFDQSHLCRVVAMTARTGSRLSAVCACLR